MEGRRLEGRKGGSFGGSREKHRERGREKYEPGTDGGREKEGWGNGMGEWAE